ncbi:hypothetical protein AQUSIP_07670 [Aquicella siphonis]|uniref:Uncharacterized protein n=1 Tax=Aquicella siphonis TaxID=254247 RepID=A0A5E4PGA4_9COXI|nr:hypothetical protein AQUSIP_07670 [Aquicella siphonis]
MTHSGNRHYYLYKIITKMFLTVPYQFLFRALL